MSLVFLESNTDIPVCVLVARGSGGAMEKEKMPAGCQRSDGATENLGKCGSAVHELTQVSQSSDGTGPTGQARIIPVIQVIIGI